MLGGGIDEEMLNGSEILSDFGEDEAFGSFDDKPYDPSEFDNLEAENQEEENKDLDLDPKFRD
jgi:hypothetical protein